MDEERPNLDDQTNKEQQSSRAGNTSLPAQPIATSSQESSDNSEQSKQEKNLFEYIVGYFSMPAVPLSWIGFFIAAVIFSIILMVSDEDLDLFKLRPKYDPEYVILVAKVTYAIFGAPLTAYACSIALKPYTKAKHLTVATGIAILYCFSTVAGLTFAGDYADTAMWFTVLAFLQFFTINTHLYRNWICKYVFRLLGIAVFIQPIVFYKAACFALLLFYVSDPVVGTQCEYHGKSYQIRRYSGGILDNSYKHLTIYRRLLGCLEQELGTTENLIDRDLLLPEDAANPRQQLVDSVQVKELDKKQYMFLFLKGDTLAEVEL